MAGAEELGKVLEERAEGEVEEVADGCEMGREVRESGTIREPDVFLSAGEPSELGPG